MTLWHIVYATYLMTLYIIRSGYVAYTDDTIWHDMSLMTLYDTIRTSSTYSVTDDTIWHDMSLMTCRKYKYIQYIYTIWHDMSLMTLSYATYLMTLYIIRIVSYRVMTRYVHQCIVSSVYSCIHDMSYSVIWCLQHIPRCSNILHIYRVYIYCNIVHIYIVYTYM